MDLQRWLALMINFDFLESHAVFNELQSLYQEKHRAYHNIIHITDCLEKLDTYKKELPFKKEMELAFWFHDCIYNPYRKDNELKSALKAKQFLSVQRAGPEQLTQVYDLIMATLHNGIPKNETEALFIDIDLSILGASPDVYSTYAAKIRKEYRRVPHFLYRKKRTEILQLFLKKDRIYHTAHYYDTLEVSARENVRSEIDLLSR